MVGPSPDFCSGLVVFLKLLGADLLIKRGVLLKSFKKVVGPGGHFGHRRLFDRRLFLKLFGPFYLDFSVMFL